MNNTISEELKELAEFLRDDPDMDIHPDWPEDLIDYADAIDRLVEALGDSTELLCGVKNTGLNSGGMVSEQITTNEAALRKAGGK